MRSSALFSCVCWLLGLVYSPSAAAQYAWQHQLSTTRPALFDSLHYAVALQTTQSHGQTPFWLVANRYGWGTLTSSNGAVIAELERSIAHDDARKWGMGYGVELAAARGFGSTLWVQQAFVEVRWRHALLTLGSKAQPMALKDGQLSTGNQALGINARPIPEVRLSLPRYWIVPLTHRWLRLKGHVAYGKPTDSGWQKRFTQGQHRYTQDALYHSKAGYVMIGNPERQVPFSVELGLEMATQFGGTSYLKQNGGMEVVHNSASPRAFWHAFFPAGSDATDGSFTNKEGNHLGAWLMRCNWQQATWGVSLYADHYFEDNSSMIHLNKNGWGTGSDAQHMQRQRYFVYDFKDWLLGGELRLNGTPWLQKVVAEYVYSKYQGGPIYHDHTPNVAEHIVGRDNFYNHHLFSGWQHWGMVMGNPLYRSPIYNTDHTIEVKNNRFIAWHIGLMGEPLSRLHYRLLATYQQGFGTYYQLYYPPRRALNLLLETHYAFAEASKWAGWSVILAAALDAGTLYRRQQGLQLTLRKTGWLNFKTKSFKR